MVDDETEQAAETAYDGPRDGAPARESSPLTNDRYRVLNRLGKGGMGEVMTVRDDEIGREVALKRIRKADPSDRLVARFLREASIQGRLEHPAIVPVHDIGRDRLGMPFFTMKKLTGTTLARILEEDPRRAAFPLQRLLRAFTEVCLAIELAHTRGVVHRDLKPENIMLGDFGEVYVLDWGVAKVVGEPDGDFADIGSGSSEHATAVGTTIGTSGYMSPEQVRGATDIDGRTDVYALGCVLFEIPPGRCSTRRDRWASRAPWPASMPARASARPTARFHPSSTRSACTRAPAIARTGPRPPASSAIACSAISTAIATSRPARSSRPSTSRVRRRPSRTRRPATASRSAGGARSAPEGERGEIARRTAMRQAASALALDPALAGAAELVGRLMLEPPRTTPREVEAEMREDDAQTTRATSRVGVWIYSAFAAFTPLLWWIAPHLSPWVMATTALVFVNIGLCAWGARVRPEGREWLIVITNAVLLGVVARMFTPFLIAPALAAMSVMTMVYTPTTSWLAGPRGMVAVTSVAILGPWLLERAGYLAVTTTVDERGILMHAAGTAGAEGPTLIAAVIYTVALLATAAAMAHAIRMRERATKRVVMVQAWQLRQLVPTQGT